MHVHTPHCPQKLMQYDQISPQELHTSSGRRSPRQEPSFNIPSKCLAAATLLLHLLASKRHARLCRGCSTGLVLHPRFDLTGHGQECLFDIRRCLRGGFQKLNPKPIGKLLSHLRRHNTFPLEITLVTHEKFVDIFTCIPVNLMKPLLHIVE